MDKLNETVAGRFLEFAIRLNGGKKAGAKKNLAERLNVNQASLTPYFNDELKPGNSMQEKLRALGADTHYIITGERISQYREFGRNDLDDPHPEYYSLLGQLQLRRDMVRILNGTIKVLYAKLADVAKRDRVSLPWEFAYLGYDLFNSEYEYLHDDSIVEHVVQRIESIVREEFSQVLTNENSLANTSGLQRIADKPEQPIKQKTKRTTKGA